MKTTGKFQFHALLTNPSIDQYVAFYNVLLATVGGDIKALTGIHFSVKTLPAANTVEEVILDVDAIERYRENGYGSATEMQSETADVHPVGITELCVMLRDNNGMGAAQKGGYLKYLPKECGPFAWLLRLVQHLELPGLSYEESQVAWLTRFMQVCKTYFDRCASLVGVPNAPEGVGYEELMQFSMAMPDLADKLGLDTFEKGLYKKREALFTLSGYAIVRYTMMTGEEWEQGGEEALREEIRFWLDGMERGRRYEVEAANVAAKISETAIALIAGRIKDDPDVKVFNTPAGRAVAYRTPVDEVASPLWDLLQPHGVNVLVAQSTSVRRNGNVGILTRASAGVDTSDLAKALMELEPDLWHDERRQGQGRAHMVLNGSKKIERTPTALTTEQLTDLCRQHLRRKPGQPQHGGNRQRYGRR